MFTYLFYMTGVCIISVSMTAGVPRRGRLSPVIALVQDTVELRAITVGLRNGFLHFKHTYWSIIMNCSLSKFPLGYLNLKTCTQYKNITCSVCIIKYSIRFLGSFDPVCADLFVFFVAQSLFLPGIIFT